MTMIRDVTNAPHCVYGHFSNGQCFYVGSGSLKRAFDFTRDRSQQYLNKFRTSTVSVVIFHRCSDRDEAYRVEKEMILALMPEVNQYLVAGARTRHKKAQEKQEKQTVKKIKREKRQSEKPKPEWKHVYPIKCIETGLYFYGSAHAGRAMDIHQARISATTLGKCSSADGYHFLRTTWDEAGLNRDFIGKPYLQDQHYPNGSVGSQLTPAPA